MDLEKIEITYEGIKHQDIRRVAEFLENLPIEIVSPDKKVYLRVFPYGADRYYMLPQSTTAIEYQGLENLANEVDYKVSLKMDFRGPHLYLERKSSKDNLVFMLYLKHSG